MTPSLFRVSVLAGLIWSVLSTGAAQTVDGKALAQFEWRSIGPAQMGGRISGIEGVAG